MFRVMHWIIHVAPVSDNAEEQSRFMSPTQKMRKTELGIAGKVHIQRRPHIPVAGKEIQPTQGGSTCLAANVSSCFLPFIPCLIHNTPSDSAKNKPKPHSQWQLRLDSLLKICSVQWFRGLVENIICDGAIIVLQLIYVVGVNKGCMGSCYSLYPNLWVPDFAAFVAFCGYIICCLFLVDMVVKTKSSFHRPLPFIGLPMNTGDLFIFIFFWFFYFL